MSFKWLQSLILLACTAAACAGSEGAADGQTGWGAGHGRRGGDGVGHGRLPAQSNSRTGAGAVALLLQLTDVHISALEGPAGDQQRAPDLLSLSSDLLARWHLAAAVVTGDLTEARNKYGSGQQDEREWQTYQAAWKGLTSHGGVPNGHVYDTRGNHDTFNSGPRCGPRDHFCRYSARAAMNAQGAAAASATAATAAAEAVSGYSSAVAFPGGAMAGDEGSMGRIFIDPVYDTTAAGAAADRPCPTMVLVGIDASLDPGLRSPTNFLGVVHQDVLAELDDRLAASVASMRNASCSPPYIAYGHYPLSTIAYPGGASRPSPPAATSPAATSAARTVQQVLLRHGVSAYLSGHLHGAFGRKLHRLHAAAPAVGASSDKGAADRAPEEAAVGGLVAAAAGRPVGHMLELESVDWKYARTLRVLTVDVAGGGVVGFEDLSYKPPASTATATATATAQHDGPSLEPHDSTCTVGSYLPLITCPPDARYGPQLRPVYDGGGFAATAGCAGAAGDPSSTAARAVVRAVLLPVGPAAPPAPQEAVFLHWSCERRGGLDQSDGNPRSAATASGGELPPAWRPRHHVRSRSQLSGVMEMRLEASQHNYSSYTVDLLAEAEAEAGAEDAAAAGAVAVASVRSCTSGLLVVQVRLGGGEGSRSTSAARPLHWRPPSPPPSASTSASASFTGSAEQVAAAGPGDPFWVGLGGDAVTRPAPLQQSTLEWVVMHVPWHRFGLAAFTAQWCVVVLGLVLAPRLAALLQQQRLRRRQRRRRSGSYGGGNSQPDGGGGGGTELGSCSAEAAAAAVWAGPSRDTPIIDRDLDRAGEGASTSVRIGCGGGICGTLKRSSSSGNNGNNGSNGSGRNAGGGDAWAASLAASTTVASSGSPLRRGGGGGGLAGVAWPCAVIASLESHGAAPQQAGAAGGGGVAWRAVSRLRDWVTWPVRDFLELARYHTVPWVALALYGIYLGVGPWIAAEFVEPAGPHVSYGGHGVLTAYGIFMRPLGGGGAAAVDGWVVAPSQDYTVITNVVMLTCIIPAMLLCASTSARWKQLADAGRPSGFRQMLSRSQAAALGVIAILDVSLCWKLSAGLGWVPVLLSPGVGWLLPLLAVWPLLAGRRLRWSAR